MVQHVLSQPSPHSTLFTFSLSLVISSHPSSRSCTLCCHSLFQTDKKRKRKETKTKEEELEEWLFAPHGPYLSLPSHHFNSPFFLLLLCQGNERAAAASSATITSTESPFMCHWNGCGTDHTNLEDLVIHLEDRHVGNGSDIWSQ